MHPELIYIIYNKDEIIHSINTAITGEKSIMESLPKEVLSSSFRMGERTGSVI